MKVGDKFRSVDNYEYKIVESIDDKHCIIEFEDGTRRSYTYNYLKYGRILKDSATAKSIIGKKFVSSDGYKCKVIDDLVNDKENSSKPFSRRRYRVQYEDGTIGVFGYAYIKSGNFFKYKSTMQYIGKEFVSSDGYKCKIIEAMPRRKGTTPCQGVYKVRFEDGTEKEFRYDTLKYNKFKKCSKKDISVIEKLFTSSDGYRCTIIEDMDIDTNISPSLRKYKVQFDDDTTKVFRYKTLLSGNFKKIDNRCKE